MRFNAVNFEIIDEVLPTDWKLDIINLYDQVEPVTNVLNKPEGSKEVLTTLKNFNAKIIAIGDENFRDPTTLYAICDDNLGSDL